MPHGACGREATCKTPPRDWDQAFLTKLGIPDSNGAVTETTMQYKFYAENKAWAKGFPIDPLHWCTHRQHYMMTHRDFVGTERLVKAPGLQLPRPRSPWKSSTMMRLPVGGVWARNPEQGR